MRYLIASASVCCQDFEWAKPENRKAFIGAGQIADNSSTLQYIKPFIKMFNT